MIINGKTSVCGIFGYPVAHSFSPAMHNAVYKALELDWVYVPFLVSPEKLETAVKSISSLNLVGVNVTVPHKQAVIPFLDELTPAAQKIGAVNVIHNQHGHLVGHNTDGEGFTMALKKEAVFQLAGKKVVVFGAGGAAKAVAVQLSLEGVSSLIIINRNKEKAENLATIIAAGDKKKEVKGIGLEEKNQVLSVMKQADLIVQGTSIGMEPNTEQCLPISSQFFRPGQLVCDLIYNPEKTKFLAKAQEAGCKVMNGLGMLLYQGIRTFEIWSDKPATSAVVEIMKNNLQI